MNQQQLPYKSGRTCLTNHMCSISQVWIDNMRLGVYIVLLIINNQENGQSHTPMQHTQANTAESKSTKKSENYLKCSIHVTIQLC